MSVGAGDAVLHHAPRVLADRVVDPRRRDAVAVLQHRIQRDPVVLLRQVLAGDADLQAVVEQLAIDAVMVPAPGQPPRRDAGDRLVHRAGAAGELQRVAAHEIAGWVGLVELLAPQLDVIGPRSPSTIVVDIADDLRPRMQHQVLADQPAGIGQPVRETAPDAEFSSRRGVPMPLQARMTTSAG